MFNHLEDEKYYCIDIITANEIAIPLNTKLLTQWKNMIVSQAVSTT